MWNNLFYYTKSERRAVYVLLILIFVLVVALVVVPGGRSLPESVALSSDSLVCPSAESDVIPTLTVFDPNRADSAELAALGLPLHVVRNVIKYRQKGGSFPTPESFARIYGLTEVKYEELKPYIRISESFVRKPVRKKTDSTVRDTLRGDTLRWLKVVKYPEGTLVDVNTVDTTELKKIPGIGSGIARAIVNYRDRLGGFCSLEQLQEIKYMTPELLRWFKLENDSVSGLDINRAGLDQLRAHPYLNFYQAKVIVEHRRKRGKITSLSQLSLYEEFTEKDLERIAAYLRFD